MSRTELELLLEEAYDTDNLPLIEHLEAVIGKIA